MLKKDKEQLKKSIIDNILFGVIVGLILIGFGIWLEPKINPRPYVDINCSYNNSDSYFTYFFINNPSKYKAEEYNLLIYDKYSGQSGGSWAEGSICNVSYHINKNITYVKCEYIPPETGIYIGIKFIKSSNHFYINSWGKTQKEEVGWITC